MQNEECVALSGAKGLRRKAAGFSPALPGTARQGRCACGASVGRFASSPVPAALAQAE